MHVLSDTLRSVAVLAASLTSLFTPVPIYKADGAAGAACGFIILMSCFWLASEVYKDLKSWRWSERLEDEEGDKKGGGHSQELPELAVATHQKLSQYDPQNQDDEPDVWCSSEATVV